MTRSSICPLFMVYYTSVVKGKYATSDFLNAKWYVIIRSCSICETTE